MSNMILFKNASIASAGDKKLEVSDVLIEGDRIQGTAPDLDVKDGVKVVDAKGKVLLPGLFDLHVHLREPGQTG